MRLAQEAELIAPAARLAAAVEHVNHLLDGRDAGDGFFLEREGVGDCADEFAVNEDGRAGHSGEDARAVNERARQAHDDDRLARRREAGQHAEDFDAELLRLRARKDRARRALLPRAYIFEREVVGLLSAALRRLLLREARRAEREEK